MSSASSQIFNAATDTFLAVGSLNTARESAAAVALPNDLTLIAGGSHCAAKTIGTSNGFQCDALQTAELYHEDTKAFTAAGTGSGGLMTVARSGPSATLISGSGTALDGQVLIVGGSSGSSFLSLPPAPAAAPPGQMALHTAELYNPATDAFTATTNAIPGCPAGTFPPTCTTGLASVCGGPTSAISGATESSGTVTITMTTANPTGLTMGDGVTINAVSVAGYNGSFTVASIIDSTHFTYTDPTTGLGAGTGGTASSDTFECGMVDQGAALIPNDNGKVLIAGGDILQFLGASSNVAFLFDPATQTFTRTGSMANARELFPLVALDTPVPAVGNPLLGDVVAYGGIQATSQLCLSTPNTPVLATTLNSAEVYNTALGTWSAATNTMGVKRTTLATLMKAGSLTGQVILPGGVDVEAGTEPSTCSALTNLKQAAQSETDLYDPTTGAGGTFTATGSLNQAREGQAQGVIGGVSADATDVLAAGGACTSASPSLQSIVIGSGTNTLSCANTNGRGPGCPATGTNSAQTDYSELYSQATQTWSCGPTNASAPTNAAAAAVLP